MGLGRILRHRDREREREREREWAGEKREKREIQLWGFGKIRESKMWEEKETQLWDLEKWTQF